MTVCRQLDSSTSFEVTWRAHQTLPEKIMNRLSAPLEMSGIRAFVACYLSIGFPQEQLVVEHAITLGQGAPADVASPLSGSSSNSMRQLTLVSDRAGPLHSQPTYGSSPEPRSYAVAYRHPDCSCRTRPPGGIVGTSTLPCGRFEQHLPAKSPPQSGPARNTYWLLRPRILSNTTALFAADALDLQCPTALRTRSIAQWSIVNPWEDAVSLAEGYSLELETTATFSISQLAGHVLLVFCSTTAKCDNHSASQRSTVRGSFGDFVCQRRRPHN